MTHLLLVGGAALVAALILVNLAWRCVKRHVEGTTLAPVTRDHPQAPRDRTPRQAWHTRGAPPEDRALLRSNPSAVWGGKTDGSGLLRWARLTTRAIRMPEGEKPRGSGGWPPGDG
jgi:hypothetical protein